MQPKLMKIKISLLFEVYDISGRKMSVKILEDKIDVSNLKNGLYILREEAHGEYISTKFIIIK